MQAQGYITLIGRVLLSLIFLMSGFGKLTDWPGTAQHMAAEGMVLVPFFLTGAIALEVLGGLSVLLGYKARWGALALIIFLIPTTLIFHDFWAYTGTEQRMQMINFLKNGSILGGLCFVYAFGPGALSLDHRQHKVSTGEHMQRAPA